WQRNDFAVRDLAVPPIRSNAAYASGRAAWPRTVQPLYGDRGSQAGLGRSARLDRPPGGCPSYPVPDDSRFPPTVDAAALRFATAVSWPWRRAKASRL